MSIAKTAKRGVVFHNSLKADDGYTLFAPLYGKDVWLIDMEGHIVHRWRIPYNPGLDVVLLPNSHILFAGRVLTPQEMGLPTLPEFSGCGGMFIEMDWDGNLLWQVKAPYHFHDFYLMENDHILYLAWSPEGILPDEIAAKLGGRPGTELKELDNKIWSDVVYEIDRDGNRVWKWIAYEHLDPEIDTICPVANRRVWPYINSVWVCRDGNILLSTRYVSQATKIEYPSGKAIGRYGKGEISYQHDCRELENGNILILDNGSNRHKYEPTYSRSVEIDPSTDQIVWEYKADPPYSFFSPIASGNERLALTGNTVICDSWHGRIFEVTMDGEIVWEYISPFMGINLEMQRYSNLMFRAHRYSRDYPGLKGKDLDPARFYWENRIFGPDAFKEDFVPCIF